jgi:hypothetical protein
MQKCFFLIAITAVGFAVFSCFAQSRLPDPDRIFTPRQMYCSASGNGCAGAGIALPWNAVSALLNPALLYSCRNGNASLSRSAYAGYGRDSLFDRFIVPLGLTCFRRRDAIAGHGRFASSGFGLTEYETAATYCRRVWTRGSRQGALDAGVNIRYEYAPWETRGLDTLYSFRSWRDALGNRLRPDEKSAFEPPPEAGKFRESRAFIDLGIFKPEIASHLDCGVTLENLIAFRWGRERPAVMGRIDTAGTHGDTTILVTSRSYNMKYGSYSGWIPLRYAVASIGWNLRIGNPAGRFSLCVPVDLKIYGLFDRAMKETYAIHSGVQVHVRRDIFLRVGYEHAPGLVHEGWRNLSSDNNVSFGASLLPAGLPVVIDLYATHNEWGMAVSTDL